MSDPEECDSIFQVIQYCDDEGKRECSWAGSGMVYGKLDSCRAGFTPATHPTETLQAGLIALGALNADVRRIAPRPPMQCLTLWFTEKVTIS